MIKKKFIRKTGKGEEDSETNKHTTKQTTTGSSETLRQVKKGGVRKKKVKESDLLELNWIEAQVPKREEVHCRHST